MFTGVILPDGALKIGFTESKELYPDMTSPSILPSFAVPVLYPIAVTVARQCCKVWWEFLWQSFGLLICHLH